MALDAVANFILCTVATAPSPASSGTSLVLTAGQGATLPSPPFNMVVKPVGVEPTAANAEILRVTNVSTDTLTIVRAQESSSARTIIIGDEIRLTLTAKIITDINAHVVAGAAVHGLPASVNVLGNRAAAGEFVQRGWDYATFSGSARSVSKAISFPVAFTTITGFATGFLGYLDSGNPTTISNFLPPGGDLAGFGVVPTTSGFTFVATQIDGSNPSSSVRVGISWVAVGT